MRSIEVSAKTRKDAIQKALDKLGVELHEVTIEILDEGSRGIFGLGARDVKVRVKAEGLPDLPEKPVERPESRPRRPEHAPRPERAEHPDRSAQQRDRAPHPDRGERKDRGPQPARPDRGQQPARPDRGQQPARPERGPQPARSERPERAPQPNRAERPERAPQGDRGERRDRGPRPERGERRDRPAQGAARPSGDRPARQGGERPPQQERPKREERERPERTPRPEPAPIDEATRLANERVGAEAAALLQEMITLMGLEAQVTSTASTDGGIVLMVQSPDSAILIGRKGRNLSAMQYLINRMALSGENSEAVERLTVDIEGYLDRRRANLEEMAQRMAQKVKETGKEVRLQPLNPQERRVVHLALQDDADVRTFSLGNAAFRSVVIAPKDAPQKPAGDRPRRSRGGSRRGGGRGRGHGGPNHNRSAEAVPHADAGESVEGVAQET
ncbi:MAG: Jag N-terminal domain-containing protein [Candidatus Hydrogenedentes bacterium]|nr:Jag N-terminal domain-containing protein [Candidatus Hydrogenedentota bacterium]